MKKIIWYIVFLFLGLSAVYGTLCYFGSSKLDIVVSKTIKAPSLMIYNQVNDFNNWKNWSSWNTQDTSIHTTISEPFEGKGAVYSWSSKKRSGKITIIESTKASNILTKFSSDINDNITNGSWTLKALSDNKTKVELQLLESEEIPFLLRGYRLLTGARRMMTDGLANDLKNIEKIVENQYNDNVYNGYAIKEMEQKERHFVINRSNVSKDKIQQFYAQNLGSIFQFLQQNKIEMNGMPSGMFFQRDMFNNQIDMASAIPIKEDLAFDEMSSYTIPAGESLIIDYLGDYIHIDKAHKAMNNYMKDRNIYVNPPILETYLTDPSKEKDPNKWLTRIVYYYSH